jgi:hypothetical protein
MPNLDQKRRATAFSVPVAVTAIPTAASAGHHLFASGARLAAKGSYVSASTRFAGPADYDGSNYSPEQMDAWRGVAPLHSTQPPYNIFEREIETDVLPYALQHKLLGLSYGDICRGLLSGKMSPNRKFDGDDLRLKDPKFQQPRFTQYLKAADRLSQHAWENASKRGFLMTLHPAAQGGAFPVPRKIPAVES